MVTSTLQHKISKRQIAQEFCKVLAAVKGLGHLVGVAASHPELRDWFPARHLLV
jgi:hypothetical protein